MILISFGTRPEYIKIKPLLEAFQDKIDYKLLLTGQHTDLLSSVEEDIDRLEIIDGDNRLDSIVSSVMNNDSIFDGIDAVLVQGDTTSAFSIALAAFHRKIKIIHLEAGLRTSDLLNPYPEEFNRQAISRMSSINLCPTQVSYDNLISEKVQGSNYIVGNTVLDNIVHIEPTYTNKVVITMHRRENHDLIPEWFRQLDEIAKNNKELEFILPIHPNPNVYKHKKLLRNVNVVKPMQYDDFVRLLSSCKFVITDSGGLQEESSFFRKKCIVCRKTTERIEGMGTFSFLCLGTNDLPDLVQWVNNDHIPDEGEECPYGDGHSAEKICRVLKENHGF
jgi:UDP-N-acetylglucosamine 2-epimerase (non-hydrolysing)